MRAIITGAASGIGLAVVERFARADARDPKQNTSLLLVDLDLERLAPALALCAGLGVRARGFAGDLSDATVPERVVASALEDMDAIDALVSNAGIVRPGSLLELDIAAWDAAYAVNTRATWLLARAAHSALAAARGSIVATASVSGTQPTANLGGYSGSKAAVVMLMEQLAFEFAPDGIRCNSVAPGYVKTGLTEPIYSDPEAESQRAAFVPLGRIGVADDIAGVIEFLCSADASYITGINVIVDGGLSTALMANVRGKTTLTR